MERGAENVEQSPMTEIDEGAATEAFSDQTEMDPNLWNKLGEDLVEEIVTRLPLKNIVQSQLLSKRWRSRFQSSSFQKEVKRLSSRWGSSNSYYPLCLTEKGLCGYDRSAQKWKNLCTLPEFPPDFNELHSTDESDSDELDTKVVGRRWRLWGRNCLVVGTLVLTWHLSDDDILQIFIINVINKTIRRCPPLQLRMKRWWMEHSTFVHLDGHDHYKVVILAMGEFAQVYDSKSNSWTEFECVLSSDWSRFGNVVYLRGVIYAPYFIYDDGVSMVVLTFDVEKGLFGTIIPSHPVPPNKLWHLVAWRSQLLHVSSSGDHFGLCVSTVNLQTLQLTEIFRGPSDTFHHWESFQHHWSSTETFVCDRDSDYIHLIAQPAGSYIYDPDTDDVLEDFSLDSEGVKTDKRILEERTCLVTCDMNKRLWSYSCLDSSDSGYDRDARIELRREYVFQPNMSPFIIA